MCKKCSAAHRPLTGKHCQQAREIHSEQETPDLSELVHMMAKMLTNMGKMNSEIETIKNSEAAEVQ